MAPLKGDGLFSSTDVAMATFLGRIGQDKTTSSAFVARNFLLDEGILTERLESYRRAGVVADHGTIDAWGKRHHAYLLGQVFLVGDGSGPPVHVDPTDVDECPETFRFAVNSSSYASVDERLDLIRVVDLKSVARRARMDPGKLRLLVDAVLAKTASGSERAELEAGLGTWAASLDLRPVFAAFLEDFRDLFGDDPSKDAANWADAIRDRLGLAHHDAATEPIEILVFRYPVRLVPKLRSSGLRPIVPPTVLDGSHSEAFCPAPKGTLTGHTVDLDISSELRARREVLHPAVALGLDHVFRVGTICKATDRSLLPLARHAHLDQVRNDSGRSDYARMTDGDLP